MRTLVFARHHEYHDDQKADPAAYGHILPGQEWRSAQGVKWLLEEQKISEPDMILESGVLRISETREELVRAFAQASRPIKATPIVVPELHVDFKEKQPASEETFLNRLRGLGNAETVVALTHDTRIVSLLLTLAGDNDIGAVPKFKFQYGGMVAMKFDIESWDQLREGSSVDLQTFAPQASPG